MRVQKARKGEEEAEEEAGAAKNKNAAVATGITGAKEKGWTKTGSEGGWGRLRLAFSFPTLFFSFSSVSTTAAITGEGERKNHHH